MSPGVGRVRRALDHQYAAALTVCAGALVALTWSAISSTSYRRAMSTSWFAGRDVDAHTIVANGVMTIFFAAVGLELSRELRFNLRRHLRASLSPLLGAVGGMAATALGSVLLGEAWHSATLRRGWGVPMATDIAFTLGVLAIAGTRVPAPLRIFLLTLAIADDVLSVIILSVTGVTQVRGVGLLAIVVVALAGVVLARRVDPAITFPFVLVAMWLAFAWAGIEPALSAVLAGLVTPVASNRTRHLEDLATRWSTGIALPLFALVACGVSWRSLSLSGSLGKVIIATVIIRLLGKMLGIGAGVYLAGKLGSQRHKSLTPRILLGATMLCAIGFTVPLLFAGAVFGSTSPTYSAYTVGLLVASVIGAVAGVLTLRRAAR